MMGFPFGGARGMPHHPHPHHHGHGHDHHGPPGGRRHAAHRGRERDEDEDEDKEFEKEFERELNKEFEEDENEEGDKRKEDDRDNGEGPSGSSETEGCGGRRRGGDRRGEHYGPRRGGRHGCGGGPRGWGGGGHGPHGHGGHHGHGHGRRGGWGRGGGPFGGSLPFNPLAFASALFDPDATRFGAADKEASKDKDNDDFSPSADIFDTPTAFVVHVSLPGAKKEDVGVNWDAEKSELGVAGVVYRPGDEKLLEQLAVSERQVGAFERKIRLGTRANPANVDAELISAKLEDGVLRIEVPKMGESGFVEIRRVDVE